MKGLVSWFANNAVAANLLMFALVALGLRSLSTIQVELFPEFSLDLVSVGVVYPGAAPEEIEDSILVPIEEEVHAIEGVEQVTSSAVEGSGTVLVECREGADPRRVLDDVKTRIDAISTFPVEAERPVIQEILLRHQVVNVAVAGDADERTLKQLGERVRDEIAALEGVSQVDLAAARPYEVSIELSEPALSRFGLTFADVADAVRAASLDLSGGSIKTPGGEVLLRTSTQAYRGAEFERLLLRHASDGARIELGHVARIVDGFADTDQAARFNGKPAVVVQVFRTGGENVLEIADAVRAYVAGANAGMPEGVELVVWQDASYILADRLSLLAENGLQGLALVFLVLMLFLRFRLAIWISLGIPIAFIGTFWVMPQIGLTLNMLTLFAFIAVLGIVVDDAIVVGERIHAEQEAGHTGTAGAILGARRVVLPVTFAILTTIVMFVPLARVPGTMGKFFGQFPLTVIPMLVFSLVESMLILPVHLAHGARWMAGLAERRPFRWWVAAQGAVARALTRFARGVYGPVLERALRWRYATAAGGVATLCAVAGLHAGGFFRFHFFPPIEGDVVAAFLRMPEGTSAEVTAGAVARIERGIEALYAELDQGEGRHVVRNTLASVGEQPFRKQQDFLSGANAFTGAHFGEVVLELVPAQERTIGAARIADRLRALVGPVPGAAELSFNADIMSAGEDVNVRLTGRDMGALAAAAGELSARLEELPGVYDIADTYRGGRHELRFALRQAAEPLGLTQSGLARQLRQAFYGEEAQRVQRGRDDVKVMVRYPEQQRHSLAGLDAMRVRTPAGGEVPLLEVATLEEATGSTTIRRVDRERAVNVTAVVDKTTTTSNEVLERLAERELPALLARHPSISYAFEGQQEEESDTMRALSRDFGFALCAMFALLAVAFRSYTQPLLVMLAIPFGLVGASLGHLIMGTDLSVLSIFGIVALCGVVVNDSLVMVDFVNQARAAGRPVLAAARQAGIERFRAIVLTSLTTFAGLTPLLLEKSVQAQFLIPLAISIAFGVLFSTVTTLFIVPAGYLILDDVQRALRWLAPAWASGAPEAQAPSGAGAPAGASSGSADQSTL